METGLLISMILLWIIVFINVILTLALIRQANSGKRPGNPDEMGLKQGQIAPDFQAQDLSGNRVTLADYRQRNTAFVFISTRCEPCREALPQLKTLATQVSPDQVSLVLVSRDSLEETQHYADEQEIHLPILVAPHGESSFLKDYHISGTPSYSYIDEQGIVQSSGILGIPGGSWETLMNRWTAQQFQARKEAYPEKQNRIKSASH